MATRENKVLSASIFTEESGRAAPIHNVRILSPDVEGCVRHKAAFMLDIYFSNSHEDYACFFMSGQVAQGFCSGLRELLDSNAHNTRAEASIEMQTTHRGNVCISLTNEQFRKLISDFSRHEDDIDRQIRKSSMANSAQIAHPA